MFDVFKLLSISNKKLYILVVHAGEYGPLNWPITARVLIYISDSQELIGCELLLVIDQSQGLLMFLVFALHPQFRSESYHFCAHQNQVTVVSSNCTWTVFVFSHYLCIVGSVICVLVVVVYWYRCVSNVSSYVSVVSNCKINKKKKKKKASNSIIIKYFAAALRKTVILYLPTLTLAGW